jgi:hypothetical protein
MTQFSELKVTIKDSEKTLTKEFPIYDSYRVSDQDDTINNCVAETLKNFAGEPEKITVKIRIDIE